MQGIGGGAPVSREVELQKQILDFLNWFEVVFDRDWDHSDSALSDEWRSLNILPGATFLKPGMPEKSESNNWAHRGGLLHSYRQLTKLIDEKFPELERY